MRLGLDFDVRTWHVRTLYRAETLKQVTGQVASYSVIITAVYETRWTGKEIYDMKAVAEFNTGKEGDSFVRDLSLL